MQAGWLPPSRNMYFTLKALRLWENANRSALHLMESTFKKVAFEEYDDEAEARLIATKRASIGSHVSLELSAFSQASVQDKILFTKMFPQLSCTYINRRRSMRKIESFCRAWIFRYRSRSKSLSSQFVILPSASMNAIMTKGHTIWSPSQIPFCTYLKLVQSVGAYRMKFGLGNSSTDFLNTLFCLWLANPVVLGVLSSIFVVCDVTLPIFKLQIIRFIRMLKKVLKLSKTKNEES